MSVGRADGWGFDERRDEGQEDGEGGRLSTTMDGKRLRTLRTQADVLEQALRPLEQRAANRRQEKPAG